MFEIRHLGNDASFEVFTFQTFGRHQIPSNRITGTFERNTTYRKVGFRENQHLVFFFFSEAKNETNFESLDGRCNNHVIYLWKKVTFHLDK